MSTALSIKGKTPSNDAITSTINYVNPNATNAQLESLATAMNDLTTNTIADITRIDKKSLMNATKLSRNLTLNASSIAWSELSTDGTDPSMIEFTASGVDETTKAYVVNPEFGSSSDKGHLYIGLFLDDTGGAIMILKGQFQGTAAPENPEITLVIPETEIYEAATATVTVT